MGDRRSATRRTHRQHRPGARFTVERANASLVLVRKIVGEIIVEFRQLLDDQELLEEADARGEMELAASTRRRLRRTFGTLERCRDELEDVGIALRDWLRGIVHFPAIIDGRSAFLCWCYDEPAVAYWHGVDEGFAQRRPVSGLREHRLRPGLGVYLSEAAPSFLRSLPPEP